MFFVKIKIAYKFCKIAVNISKLKLHKTGSYQFQKLSRIVLKVIFDYYFLCNLLKIQLVFNLCVDWVPHHKLALPL
jgi:hypothetical protein